MGKCKYCQSGTNDFVPLHETAEYSGIEIAVNRQGMLRARALDPKGHMAAQDVVMIACCPACGRKFEH